MLNHEAIETFITLFKVKKAKKIDLLHNTPVNKVKYLC